MRLLYWLDRDPAGHEREHIESIIPNVVRIKLIPEDGSGGITVEQGDGCFIIRSDKEIKNVVPVEAPEIH
jgi:hypothetical protein